MKKLVPFIILFVFLGSGCKQLILWKYGVRNPKKETAESIRAYATKYGQDPGKVWLFRDSTAFSWFSSDSIYRKTCFGAIVFNDIGLLLNYRDSSSCQWSAAAYVNQLKRDTTYRIDESRKFPAVFSYLVPLAGRSSLAADTSRYDYTVVFTWAKYLGKMNERLFTINDAARSNPHANIRVISLNIDMQKSWGLRKSQKLHYN